MKKIALLFSVCFVALNSLQINAQQCSWAKKAGGTNEDFGVSAATDNSGNVYYLGNFYSQTIVFGTTTLHNQPYQAFNYGSEMYLVKYDSCGNFKWAKQAGGNDETRAKRLVTDAAGNVYVCGFAHSDTTYFGSLKLINKRGYDIAFVVKYDANGIAQWVQQGSGYNNRVRASAIALDGSGNIYVTGIFWASFVKFGNDSAANEYNQGDENVFIAKFANNGNIQWIRSGGGDFDAFAYGISTDGSGNVYVCGSFGSSHIRFGNDSLPLSPGGSDDIFIVKYNAAGTEQWLRVAGSDDHDEALSLAADASGNTYVTGYIGYTSTVTFGTHPITNPTQSLAMFLAKYDASGTAQWARVGLGDSYTDSEGNNVKLDVSGDPYVIGFYNSDSLRMGPVTLYNNSMTAGGGDSLFDIFVAKYKKNGVLSWARTAGGDKNDFGNAIAVGSHNSLYITGGFTSPTISFGGIPLTLTTGSIAGDEDAFIANNISLNPTVPNICMVTVDSILSKNNMIAWDKTQFGTQADSIIIYRETGTGNYQPIGAVSSNALSIFTDTVQKKYFPNTGDPNSGTYRYKIAFRDTAGNYSLMSPYHNTIFITNNNGTFSWAQLYTIENSANPVSNYVLMRDDNSNGNWHPVTSVAGTQQQASDPAYNTFKNTASWRVETQWNISCAISIIKDPDPMASNLNLSKSNINRLNGNAVSEIENNIVMKMSPNPSDGKFVITAQDLYGQINEGVIEIYNLYGAMIQQVAVGRNSHTAVDISSESPGVYFIKIKTEQGRTAVQRIVKNN